MKLYCAPGACSLAVHIITRELDTPVELELMNFPLSKTPDGQTYSEVNPKGKVPALALDEGGLLTELTAIVQYLADRKPEIGLLSATGTLERYRAIEWLGFINSEVHRNFGILFRPDFSDVEKTKARAAVVNHFTFMDKRLAGKPFALGKQFTVVDPYIFVVASWAQRLQFDFSAWPALRAHFDEIASRPAVRQALEAEGLVP